MVKKVLKITVRQVQIDGKSAYQYDLDYGSNFWECTADCDVVTLATFKDERSANIFLEEFLK